MAIRFVSLASTVGFPRESRISRALTLEIFAIFS